jgi:hypothetical protein
MTRLLRSGSENANIAFFKETLAPSREESHHLLMNNPFQGLWVVPDVYCTFEYVNI